MTDTARPVKIRLREELEKEIFELEERLRRHEEDFEVLCYQHALVSKLGQESPDLQEIDEWEFEEQILRFQCQDARSHLEMLRQELARNCRLLEYVIRDLGEIPRRRQA